LANPRSTTWRILKGESVYGSKSAPVISLQFVLNKTTRNLPSNRRAGPNIVSDSSIWGWSSPRTSTT
jgi:hypothetical protein